VCYRRRWEAHILATVAARPGKKAEYIILRSGQLVGTAMIILCQRSVVEEVRNIEASTKKTGLKGMAGNKVSTHSPSPRVWTDECGTGCGSDQDGLQGYLVLLRYCPPRSGGK
jgi:hypothetical protein